MTTIRMKEDGSYGTIVIQGATQAYVNFMPDAPAKWVNVNDYEIIDWNKEVHKATHRNKREV